MGPIPEGCNGLVLLDETKEFSKWNCKWVRKKIGRFSKNPEKSNLFNKKSNTSYGKIKQPKSICLSMEQDHLDFIKEQALQQSLKEGVYIEPNELIRQALQKAFPSPTLFDMFGERK